MFLTTAYCIDFGIHDGCGRCMMRRIFVDADACPVKEIIISQAKANNIPVVFVCDTSHELNVSYGSVVIVDRGADSADYKIVNLLAPGDIVVTQDYGVAAMALGKRARAIHQSGMVYSDSNMDRLLFERHLGQKVRRAGGRTKGMKKRSTEDDDQFAAAFATLLLI
jgi:uncharacterized protein YaiI (UPF0178 family)